MFVFPAFVYGAEAITIIGEDGTKQVIPLEAAPSVPESVVRAKKNKRSPPRIVPPGGGLIPPSVVRIKDNKDQSLNIVEGNEAQADQEIAEPIEAIKPQIKPKDIGDANKQAGVQDFEKSEELPKPNRKPSVKVSDDPVRTAKPIPKNEAIAIALSVAPPSRDMQVTPFSDEQGLMYSVLFKTDNGAYEVLVDAHTQQILRSEYKENGQAIVEPGHLPVR